MDNLQKKKESKMVMPLYFKGRYEKVDLAKKRVAFVEQRAHRHNVTESEVVRQAIDLLMASTD